MNKNKILIIFLILFLLLISFFFFMKNETIKTVEINFISDHPIALEGVKLPGDIQVFSEVLEINEAGLILYPIISFKRLDLNNSLDFINYSNSITNKLSTDEAKSIYLNETPNISASLNMTAISQKMNIKSIESDTTKIRYFYLLCSTDTRVDGKLYFDNAQILKNYIVDQLNKGTLYRDDQKPNTINIIMQCDLGSNNAPADMDEKTPIRNNTDDNVITDEPKNNENEIPQKPKRFSSKLKLNGNDISWNTELKSADELIIVFKSKVDGKVLVRENVTGSDSFTFSYSNSIYEASNIEIKLSGKWSNGSSIAGCGCIVTDELECH